ncbi:radical SAM protein [Streptomyces sp. NPDC002520]
MSPVTTVSQPPRDQAFVGKQWWHRYTAMTVTRGSDGAALTVPCASIITEFADFNPRWYIDRLVRTGLASPYLVFLDVTNACTDDCPMCFTATKRYRQGLHLHQNVDVTLARLAELKAAYPDTFRLVGLSGSGEPLLVPDAPRLMHGIADLGMKVHMYTAGLPLMRPAVQEATLASAVSVRISLDATTEDAFRATHTATGLKSRINAVRGLVKKRSDAGPLIGVSMVIQRANHTQIRDFARMAADLGVDWATLHQETYGVVTSAFTPDEQRQITEDLAWAEELTDDTFVVDVPHASRRYTATERVIRSGKLTPIPVLDRCLSSRHRLSFDADGGYSACVMSAANYEANEESRIGQLTEDSTMQSIHTAVRHGAGTALGRPADLDCARCECLAYDRIVEQVLPHLAGETDWDVELVPYVPGVRDPDYALNLVTRGAGR